MNFIPATHASLLAFVLIVFAILMALLMGIFVSSKKSGQPALLQTLKVAKVIVIWLVLCSSVVESGLLFSHVIPLVPIFFVLNIAAAILFSFSPFGSCLALGLPLQFLVGFQGFRLLLELVLHSWALQGTIPMTMTWSGQNFDFISGIVAIVLAPFAGRSQAVAWIANVVGLVLLINVLRVIILSSPLPFAWHVEPPLQLIFYFPYFLIIPVCVGGALVGHVVLTRALLRRK